MAVLRNGLRLVTADELEHDTCNVVLNVFGKVARNLKSLIQELRHEVIIPLFMCRMADAL
jgi:hypothetical protein